MNNTNKPDEGKKRYLPEEQRVIYNEAVRDTLKELWLYDGLIPDEDDRKLICNQLLEKCSYAHPEPIPLKFQQP